MTSKWLLGTLLATALVIPAAAQQQPPQNAQQTPPATAQQTPPATAQNTTTNMQKASGQWRASKLIGLDVYNEQNEKLGDISELLVDQSGKINGVVLGVGGFLGMGQRDIMVTMDKLRFVNEPVRTSATDSNANRPAGTTGTGTADRPATTANTARSDNRWYPDHAVMSGATKDSLKNMQEFKYD